MIMLILTLWTRLPETRNSPVTKHPIFPIIGISMHNHPEPIDEQLLQEPSQAGIFLQSTAWGAFQTSVRNTAFVKQYHTQKVQIIVKRIFRWVYWYVPRARMHQKTVDAILADALEQNVVYVHFEPLREVSVVSFPTKNVAPLQPHQTLIIPVLSDDTAMLTAMHSKTRYNISLARKKGVEVIIDTEGKYTEDFVRLVSHTGERNRFGTHSPSYYRACIQQESAFLVVARFNGDVIAVHLYWEFGDTVTYLHGGSASVHREVMGPYAVHLTALQETRRRGCLYYDMWGIDDVKWVSLTRFKKGFGGFVVDYPAGFHAILSLWQYRIISLARFVKRLV